MQRFAVFAVYLTVLTLSACTMPGAGTPNRQTVLATKTLDGVYVQCQATARALGLPIIERSEREHLIAAQRPSGETITCKAERLALGTNVIIAGPPGHDVSDFVAQFRAR
jgi:hypothetical protein